MIAQIGLIAHAAASGQDALQFLLNPPVPISAVLLDLTMPIVSGAETYSLIRSAYPDLPIILMSGYPAQEAIGQLNSQDQPSFLQKPFSLNALRTAIAQVLPQERV
jgi:CheY-like chemotaxis protein